jgi:hypothetical protein
VSLESHHSQVTANPNGGFTLFVGTTTDGIGQPAGEVSEWDGELVAADEATVVAKPSFDAIVMEDS